MKSQPISLTENERAELERRTKSRAGRADEARIARVLLLLADGMTYREIADRIDCSEPFISKWKKRFVAEGLAGLYVRHEGRPVTVLTTSRAMAPVRQALVMESAPCGLQSKKRIPRPD